MKTNDALGTIQNTTSEQKLLKISRLYAFISQVNQKIVRIKDEDALFKNSCQLAIEFGKFKMAWIGLFDSEKQTVSFTDNDNDISINPITTNGIYIVEIIEQSGEKYTQKITIN